MLSHVRRAVVAFAATTALATVACGPAAPQFTAVDEAALTKIFSDAPGFFLSGAADSWAATFSTDAVFQPANGPAVNGRDGLVPWFKTLPPMESFTFGTPKVHGAGSTAYLTSSYVVKFKDIPADTGKQLVVAQRSATGKWELVAVSFNSDLPLPAGQPAKPVGKAPAKAPAKAK